MRQNRDGLLLISAFPGEGSRRHMGIALKFPGEVGLVGIAQLISKTCKISIRIEH